jgi:hypothetical protein
MASGYVPNVHHPDVLRAILQGIVETGDVLGAAGPGRTVLAVTVDDWLLGEMPRSRLYSAERFRTGRRSQIGAPCP